MLPTKIRKLYLPNFQQFRGCIVDLTDKDGRAADRICLIGRNGTGKSTLLRLLDAFLRNNELPAGIGLEVERDGRRIFLPGPGTTFQTSSLDFTGVQIDHQALLACDSIDAIMRRLSSAGAVEYLWDDSEHHSSGEELVAYCPADPARGTPSIDGDGHPRTNLNAVLKLFATRLPFYHEISDVRVADMWKILVFLVKKRESDRQSFETRPESLQKTKAQLIAEFDATNPPVLEGLGALWNRILEPAGLELDIEGAKLPVQLTDNLEAYIRLRGSKQRIPYSALSTGIRNFLFRIGHLFLLYFNRKIDPGFVLIDEPENSLFPDFLFDLMNVYEEILRDRSGRTSTQLIVATHSPIVAAQFEPDERIVLEWTADATVTAGKGTAPKGDDPNDLLRKDFHLGELMGPEGVRNWQQYLDLRRRIRHTTEAEKPALVAQALEIAERYGFEPPK